MKTELKKLSVEQLMEIAKHPIKEDEFKKLPPVKRFLTSEKIENGKDVIPAAAIYDRYLKWASLYKVKPVNQIKFFKELALYFNKKRIANGNAYILSSKGFDLSPEGLILANEKMKPKKRISNGKKNKEEPAS